MKKVISLVLTIAMALSMFSCLTVIAGAVTTDLVVDQEYIVASDTTKIFVPEEAGYYKFASNGYGDPKITITTTSESVSFDDDINREFCGIVYLEAGEAVECYLYNFQNEDCVFTITKTVGVTSFEFEFAKPIEIIENTKGYYTSDWIWNEETNEEIEATYYCYNTPSIYIKDSVLTINYSDGTSVVYFCDGEYYVDAEGERVLLSSYTQQNYNNQWGLGSDNYLIVQVKGYGATCNVPVTIIENPVESVSFTLGKPIEIIENTQGYYNSDSICNEETGEWEDVTYYRYYTPDIYIGGNSLTLNYKNGTSEVYTYDWDCYNFVNSSGDTLYVDCYDRQSYSNQWTLGSDNCMYVELPDYGVETAVPVAVIENPVESISFAPEKPIEIIENTNGYYEDWYNSDTKEWETRYFYDQYSISQSGNVLTVNYTDGSSVDYTYSWIDGWCDSEGNGLGYSIYSYDYQSSTPWTIGGENYIWVKYLERETKIPVSIIEDPVESISFTSAKPIEIVENTNGYYDSDSIWNEENGEWEEVTFYRYYTPGIYREGNSITVNYKDGTNEVYTYDSYNEGFVNFSGDLLYVECYSRQSYANQWTLGSDNYMIIEAYGIEKTIKVPVTIVENPVESISFTPAKPIEILENSNGRYVYDWIWNEETEQEEKVEYYCYSNPSIYREGNSITLNYKDGTSEVYTYDWDCGEFINSSGDAIYVDYYDKQSYSNQWTLGSDNYMYVKLPDYGVETAVPVTITANPVESISFTLAKPIEIIENTDGRYEEEWIWNEETEQEEKVEYYCYSNPSIYREGNSITLNYKDGTSEVYTYDWDCGEFINSSGDAIYVDYYDKQSYSNQWTLGSDNYMYVKLPDYGVETAVPVTIIENPYESIEFIPGEPLVFEQYTNGYWSTRINEETMEEETYFCYYIGDMVYTDGSVINLIKKDGTADVYTCNGWDYYNSDGEYLSFSFNYGEDDWVVGSENNFIITAMGVSCDVYVTITEGEPVVTNNLFVADIISEDSCIITDINTGDNYNGSITIPEEIEGYKVVGIYDCVLCEHDELEELNLPSTFSMISEYLFAYCYDLKTVNVSEDNEVFASVNGVLYNKDLTEILYCPVAFNGELVIKAGVTELPENVIACLGNVSTVVVEEGNTAFAVEEGILYNSDFTKIYKAFSTETDFVMKPTVTEIADYSFSGIENLESVTFSSGVTEISYAAFLGCSSLANVELPETLVSIGDNAFTSTGLNVVTLPITTRTIGYGAFADCRALAEFNLNKGLESVGPAVFESTSIRKIVLPDSLTSMGYGCFAYNENLSDVTIGSGLTSVPNSTFYWCSSLKNIDIPENIEFLGYSAFSNSGLTEVVVPDTVITMDGAFSWCSNLKSAIVGSGVTSMDYAFNRCENLESVELAEGISGSSEYAFAGCEKLGNVDLPSTVTELSYSQFKGCSSIDDFDIPETLYKVEAHALDDTEWYENQNDGDVYLEHVLYKYKGEMPEDYALAVKNGTTSIAESAFDTQVNLVSVSLPDGLKYIGSYAFFRCPGVDDITIPSSVEFIGDRAIGFSWDGTYDDVTIRGVKGSAAEVYADENGFTFIEIEEVHSHNFVKIINVSPNHPHTTTFKCDSCDETQTESGVVSDCVECNFTITKVNTDSYKLVSYIGGETDVSIPATYKDCAITEIAKSCFKNNDSIVSVRIADGVASIGDLAFMNCTSLEKVIIPSSVTTIGNMVFYGFEGTIYCEKGSFAHQYAVDNGFDYVLVNLKETDDTRIDYENFIIYTTVENSDDIEDVVGVSENTVAIPTASFVSGNQEFYGTGTTITVFDSGEYVGEFTLIVEGDVDSDSVCDVLDCAQVARASNGFGELDGAYAMAADGNQDSIIDYDDYQFLVNKVLS